MGRKRNGNAGIQPDTPAKQYHGGFSDMTRSRESNGDAMSPEGDDMSDGFWKNVTKYGLGTVGFVVLGYFMLTDVRADQEANRSEHQSLRNSTEMVATITKANGESLRQILYVMQVSCANQARSDAHRRDCLGGYTR